MQSSTTQIDVEAFKQLLLEVAAERSLDGLLHLIVSNIIPCVSKQSKAGFETVRLSKTDLLWSLSVDNFVHCTHHGCY